MFETRNDRGLGVSGLDIVKNWMLYAEQYWEEEDSPGKRKKLKANLSRNGGMH